MSFSSFGNYASPYDEFDNSLNSAYCSSQENNGDSGNDVNRKMVGGANEQIEETIKDFFMKNPNPKNTQIHALVSKLGIDKRKFEEIIYKMFTKNLQISI